jgi:hypothetical protein
MRAARASRISIKPSYGERFYSYTELICQSQNSQKSLGTAFGLALARGFEAAAAAGRRFIKA